MKFLKKVDNNYILLAIVILLSLFPLYQPGFFDSHDGVIHVYRTAGYIDAIQNGEMPVKIMTTMINGFGYGSGIFYPSLAVLIPAVFYFLGFGLIGGIKLCIMVASVVAGIFMYKLCKTMFKNDYVALIVTILYILSPYRMGQIFVRGSYRRNGGICILTISVFRLELYN